MKKSISKPLNWQDFEDLCKVLWGEIWRVQDKIKKNGRLGQSQSGVDIYAVPENKTKYHGIQCKGKDDYTSSKLTQKEIDEEIENAKKFKPELEVFIFATSANKDASIEQYVREKDIESRLAGGFEILLYCWEDIADLIEKYKETFNYYVLSKQFKTNYEFELTFSNGTSEYVVNPSFKKIVTKHRVRKPSKFQTHFGDRDNRAFDSSLSWLMRENKNVNCSWATFTINFKNTGSEVLEDYKLYIYPEENKYRKIGGFLGNILDELNYLKYSPLYVNTEENYAVYRPKENAPLIQKDSRSFDLHILANHEKYELKIKYELLARNFNMEGELTLIIDPKFEAEEKTIWVDDETLVRDAVSFEDLMTTGGMFP